jgi:hypothetical protein
MNQATRLFAGAFAFFVCFGVAGWFHGRDASVGAAPRQSEENRTVDIVNPQMRMDAVIITKITVGDQQIQPGVSSGPHEDKIGQMFLADDNWLKNMSITLMNRTDKIIVRASIKLYFPDTGDGDPSRPVTSFPITLGQLPEMDLFTSKGEKRPPETSRKALLWAPGQTLVIRLADYIDEIQSGVEENISFSQVTRVVIDRILFFFADGLRWGTLEGFAMPDPNHPGKYTNMGPRYFPGDATQNLPPRD